MQCSECGGLVEWQGQLSNLTHTECLSCGAINSQLPENIDECECENLGSECHSCEVEL